MKFKNEYKSALQGLPNEETANRIKENVLKQTTEKRSHKTPIKIAAVSTAGVAAAAVLVAVIVPKIADRSTVLSTTTTSSAVSSDVNNVIAEGSATTAGSAAGEGGYAGDQEIANEEIADIDKGNDAMGEIFDSNFGEISMPAMPNGAYDFTEENAVEESEEDAEEDASISDECAVIEFTENGCNLIFGDAIIEYTNSGASAHFMENPQTEIATDSEGNSYNIYRDGKHLYIFNETMDSAECYFLKTEDDSNLTSGASPQFTGNAE